jgi:hypothetical protein
MSTSDARAVDAYLAGLPDDRRIALQRVREVVLEYLPAGFEESTGFGMITYEVPLATFPDTYNGRPLMYAALANQKRHMAVYLTSVYADPDRLAAFRDAWTATGRRLDMGKSCVRFRSLEDVPLEVLGDIIGGTTVEEFTALERAARGG